MSSSPPPLPTRSETYLDTFPRKYKVKGWVVALSVVGAILGVTGVVITAAFLLKRPNQINAGVGGGGGGGGGGAPPAPPPQQPPANPPPNNQHTHDSMA
ncbi:Hypp1936 [Branchiostoma lanceolatum]|uniref:Hypp1936 protein n=1 Tax=Branchiostoma lanceolatum TaxID=7740 RepID=A0A8K0ER43_BRALA|nr:Hypp1936 [Branchiostoma lanceolatum]